MDWNYERASNRIQKLEQERPGIIVEDVGERLQFLAKERSSPLLAPLAAREALVSIPRDRALIVDAVHVYARLSNYDDYRIESGAETELSHKRALAFLHLLYGAMDRVVQDFGAQRVDYHGPRLHCVVVDPVDNEQERVLKALALSNALLGLVRLAAQEIGQFEFYPRLKIGVDTGKCVAINDGIGCEQEPLFLGNPANYAAKLADGDGEGIFMSGRVRAIVGVVSLHGLAEERSMPLQKADLTNFRRQAYLSGRLPPPNPLEDEEQVGRLLNQWRSDIREHGGATGVQDFQFHAHTPPLRSIDYNQLSPANSIRMPVASIFADLDGYTAFIDRSMGSGKIGEAIRALHILRGELHNVLKLDFQSRKVRYIGDCIHGVLAFGNASAVDLPQTAREAVKCAAGMQASFEIIQGRLGGLDDLGLAIGIEVGPTPISRIGIRGTRSVRVASSTATIQSQVEQERIHGSAIAIGPEARQLLSLSAQRHFQGGVLVNPDYDDVTAFVAGAAMLGGAHSGGAHPVEFRPHTRG